MTVAKRRMRKVFGIRNGKGRDGEREREIAKRERNRGGAAAVAASTQRRSSGGLEVVPAKVLYVHLVAQVERHSGGGRFVPIIAAAAAPRFTGGSTASNSIAAKFEISKYDGKIDFGLWQKRIKAVLVQQGLHKALLGKEKSGVKKDEEWEELDLKVISTIQMSLTDEIMYNVVDADTTVDLWKKLEELYMSKSLTNKLYVKRQLYSLRMSESNKLLEHMNAFNKLISQLRSMDVKVEEEDQALLLLSSLPKSYDHLVTTILYGKDTLKMKEVMTTLLSNETRSKPGPSTSEEWFTSFRQCDGGRVLMGNDSECKTLGIGSIRIKMFDGTIRTLTDVRYVPDLRKSLISLGTLEAAGCSYTSEGRYLKVKKGALVFMKGERSGTLYKLIGTTIAGDAAVSEMTDEDSSLLWHARLGHMSERRLLELHKKGLLKGVKTCKLDFCETCVLGKQHRVKFVTSTQRSKQALEYIHSDVWGPAPEPSLGGVRYFVTFIDDFSRKVWIYFLKHKSEVFEKFKVCKTTVEKQTGKRVKYLRSDNGGEYTSAEFQEYCNQKGITRHLTIPGTPQQNGVAKRMNRTLLERARCMRLFADLPRSF
ncbi:hypothetical protein KSP39_PZI020142 [Platanthera zijinensis]|uniref:Integrase catalytic domain-containing protein n=1 Tax=Platanthera zijinensis TaxID=2320716 RepID=A0AAP0B0C7_9ASPA